MAACSSSPSTPVRGEPLLGSSLDFVPAHDIFLSHSGAQKPFVDALYQRLRTCYSTFFDITDHSLPLGELFPPNILRAAKTCRMAVVVLSQDFVRSKWPMVELCAFVEATPPPKIVPLFLKLTAGDLKEKQNLDKWLSTWQKFAEEDPRVNVDKWKYALKKLSSYNGITLKKCEEESAYIERVFSRICENLLPSIREDLSGLHGIHRLSEIVLAEFERLDSDQSKVCVLGMYGLPGSGKSTICRYLCKCLFPQFAGKATYLELPTNANDEEVLSKCKELLKQLTNFNNKMDLSCVSNLRQAYHFLKGTDVVISRVFLIVDNIFSQKSRNFVKALLRLGLAGGSKVLLVARSINVLQPLLQEDGSHQSRHYAYGSMSVPGLNNREALRILLQSGDGMGLADSYAPEVNLTPRHKEIMEEVASMSGFSGKHGCTEYLPLVLKIMGEQLCQHELNVEKWSRTMKSFQMEIGLCKEEVLKQMVLKSFKTLPGLRLRALFLDVALFIVPLSYVDGESQELEEACSHLSLIHGCKPQEIEFEMQKLQQRGFLTLWKGGDRTPTIISVHDFYLQFAASIGEASKYYWSSGLRWNKIQRNQAIEAVGTTQFELRTVVLELDERYEHFEFSSDFSSVKAMVLRNCKSLKTLKGFANLRRLVSLEIWNCPSLEWVEAPATGHTQSSIQRFKWVNQMNKGPNVEMLQQRGLVISSAMKASWWSLWENELQIRLDALLLQMKGLAVLKLENTGIRQYVDMSGCLPQLRVLEVRECHMEGVRVCNLPNLKRFVAFGNGNRVGLSKEGDLTSSPLILSYYIMPHPKRLSKEGVMMGKDFLVGCPKVQEVYMQCVAFENEAECISIASPHLTQLRINGLWNAPRPLHFNASFEFLKELVLCECPELRSLDLGCIFRNLQELNLDKCDNLREVSGFGELSMLQALRIRKCRSLQIVSNLGDTVSLQDIVVLSCPKLQRCLLPDLNSLINLRNIVYKGSCTVNWTVDVRKYVKLAMLCLVNDNIGNSSRNQMDLATRLGIKMVPCCFSLTCLTLCRLEDLRSLNGIQFLGSLKVLELLQLQNLSCLQGIERRVELEIMRVVDCASVEEMPSLSALVKLRSLECNKCKKLRSVEGCGELDQLEWALFTDCKSLAHCPLDFKNLKDIKNNWFLEFRGSRFASGEAVVAWAGDEKLPKPFRYASVRALRGELFDKEATNSRKTSELLLERVLQMMEEEMVKEDMSYEKDNNDDNYEEVFIAHVNRLPEEFRKENYKYEFISADLARACYKVLKGGVRCFAKLSKQRLIDLCYSNTDCLFFLYYLYCYLCKLQINYCHVNHIDQNKYALREFLYKYFRVGHVKGMP